MNCMKILVLSGSTRPKSQSRKVADIIVGKLKSKQQAEVELLDLCEAKLPIYDDGEKLEWEHISKKLIEADGFVWVVPEWNGTAGPGIMNLLAYLKQQICHKPVLLVGVSSGIGGAYPLAQIRGFGAKNSRAVFVPESIRILNVKDFFNGEQPDPNLDSDATLHARTDYALDILLAYTTKLGEIRSNDLIDPKRYTSGY
jgi:NAD(P)H-dependent FMN reductase